MIILTGGAGFIGSCFLWRLNQEGITDIIIVDELDSSEKWKNLSGKKFKDYLQKDEFLNYVESDKFPRPKTIVHMGACSSTTNIDADYFIRNNYNYSKKLALWSLKKKAAFIYASSAATYGRGEFGYDDDTETLFKLRPLNMYGYSKHMFDLWLVNNNLLKTATGLKFFNVFGPNEYHKGPMQSLVCKKFPQLNREGKITLFKSYDPNYKDGEQKRDFIYIKDAVEVMYYFLVNPAKKGIFNLGTGLGRTWNDLAVAMFNSWDKKPRIEYIEMPDYLRPKYQYFTEANINKLRSAGYLREFTPLEEAVSDYITFLKQHSYL
jgi:ADP-L-glycero-D-manno-heptose 6-epimerase